VACPFAAIVTCTDEPVVRTKYPGDRDRQEAVQHDFLESDRIKTFDPPQDAQLLPEIAKETAITARTCP
jgi:hypothetical protein